MDISYQCGGSGMFIPDPGSDFFPSRIRIKEFKYFIPQKSKNTEGASYIEQICRTAGAPHIEQIPLAPHIEQIPVCSCSSHEKYLQVLLL
jgi:hypothetical protein